MTEGHKHRTVHVSSFEVWWVRLLRVSLWHRRAITTVQFDKVDASPYPYGLCDKGTKCPHFREYAPPSCYVLTTLGVLHRWFGLVLSNEPKRP